MIVTCFFWGGGEGQGVWRLNRKYRTIYRSVVNSYEGALATRLSSLTLSAQNQINLIHYLVAYNMTLGTSPSPRSCQKDKVCYFLCVPTLLFHVKLKSRYEFHDKSWSTSNIDIPMSISTNTTWRLTYFCRFFLFFFFLIFFFFLLLLLLLLLLLSSLSLLLL